MTDIINQIPWQISSSGGPGSGGSYSLKDYEFDYALGGIPFLSATRDAWPYSERMAEIRKQQFDSFAEPGEQSISGSFWWLRSQSNFAGGAGVIYQDPDNDNQFNFRFADSLGVDPWTNGELKLLKQPTQAAGVTSSFNKVRGFVDPSGVDSAWYTDGGNFWKLTASGVTGVTNPSAGTMLGLASSGSRYFLLASDGVWSGVNTAAATQMYTAVGTPTSGTIEFTKSRIVWAWNNALYADPIQVGAPAAPTGAFFTHTNPLWQWTSITEGPNAIYAAGTDGTKSEIWKFVPDMTATPFTWTPTVTATMPTGETIRTIYAYVGSFVGIATNKGFRVGEFDGNGDIAYGPVLFSPASGCEGIVGFDRFMYVGSTLAHDGASGLFRVDLGQVIQEQTTRAVRYAYARDIYAPLETSPIQNVTLLGASGRLVFSVTQDSIWLQDDADLYPSGYLQTGRIRFNTEEPKLYKFASLRAPIPLQGTLQFSLLTQEGDEVPYITYGPSLNPNSNDIATPTPQGGQNWIALKFTLGRGLSDSTIGAVLNGWQIKALPGSIRQRMIEHTFLLFDEEMDKGGQRVGTDGYARTRFEDFKALARAGDSIVFQELKEDLSTIVVIDDWRFTQLAPPGPNDSTLGGYLTVSLRTVAEST